MSLGEWSQTFERIMLSSSSMISSPRRMKINATQSCQTSETTHMTRHLIPEGLNPYKVFNLTSYDGSFCCVINNNTVFKPTFLTRYHYFYVRYIAMIPTHHLCVYYVKVFCL
jgi:hypothetical protein